MTNDKFKEIEKRLKKVEKKIKKTKTFPEDFTKAFKKGTDDILNILDQTIKENIYVKKKSKYGKG